MSRNLTDADVEAIADALEDRLQLARDREWFTLTQAADYLGLGRNTVRDMAARGEIASSKPSARTVMFRRQWLDDWASHDVRVAGWAP